MYNYYEENELLEILQKEGLEGFQVVTNDMLDIQLIGELDDFLKLVKRKGEKVVYYCYETAREVLEEIPELDEFEMDAYIKHAEMIGALSEERRLEIEKEINRINEEIEKYDITDPKYLIIFFNDSGKTIGIEERNPNYNNNVFFEVNKFFKDLEQELTREDMKRKMDYVCFTRGMDKKREEDKKNKKKSMKEIRDRMLKEGEWEKGTVLTRTAYARRLVEEYNEKYDLKEPNKICLKEAEEIIAEIRYENKKNKSK